VVSGVAPWQRRSGGGGGGPSGAPRSHAPHPPPPPIPRLQVWECLQNGGRIYVCGDRRTLSEHPPPRQASGPSSVGCGGVLVFCTVNHHGPLSYPPLRHQLADPLPGGGGVMVRRRGRPRHGPRGGDRGPPSIGQTGPTGKGAAPRREHWPGSEPLHPAPWHREGRGPPRTVPRITEPEECKECKIQWCTNHLREPTVFSPRHAAPRGSPSTSVFPRPPPPALESLPPPSGGPQGRRR